MLKGKRGGLPFSSVLGVKYCNVEFTRPLWDMRAGRRWGVVAWGREGWMESILDVVWGIGWCWFGAGGLDGRWLLGV